MIFIHVMLNDICLPCCHLPKKLFQDTPVYSVPDAPISRQIIATVYQKLHWQYPKWNISEYWDIDTKIFHVMIYDISVSLSYYHWNLLWTAITCTTISTLMKFCRYKWHKDLQQLSTEKWIHMSYEIYLPYSEMCHHLLFL